MPFTATLVALLIAVWRPSSFRRRPWRRITRTTPGRGGLWNTMSHRAAAGDRGRPAVLDRQRHRQGRGFPEETGGRREGRTLPGRSPAVRRTEGDHGAEKGTVPFPKRTRRGQSPFPRPVSDPLLARRDHGPVSRILGQAGGPRIAEENAGEVERGGAGVQRLPAQGGRQGTDRQRRPPHPAASRTTRPSAAPPGRPARRSGRWWWPISRNWSACATRPPANWAFRTTTSCSFTWASRAKSS